MVADVIVIGAGPAGATVGGHIARAGYEVLILEKNRSPGKNKVCGGALSKTCFTDLKLPNKIIEKECSRFRVHFPEEKLEVLSKPGFVLFNREIFDELLAQKAAENGARLLTSTLVSDVIKHGDKLAVHYVKLPRREMQEVQARIVVFADGTRTLAYKKFKIGFEGKPNEIALTAMYDLRWPNNPLDSLDFFFREEISPFGYGWIFPKKDSISVGVLCLQSKMKQSIRQYLDYFVSQEKLSSLEVIRFGSRLMPQSIVEKIYADSVLVVGDAAGTADPVDGGGIFNAIVSGEVAAKVAVEALKAGNVTANFLASYDDLWKKTENYRLFHRSYVLQRLALETGVNIGIFLKQMGFFDQYDSSN